MVLLLAFKAKHLSGTDGFIIPTVRNGRLIFPDDETKCRYGITANGDPCYL